MSEFISPLATVDPAANIAESVDIGPNCVVGPDVEIGPGTRLVANVVLRGRVTIGRYNMLHPGCVIGGEPQDISYREEPTSVTIGDHNIIREGVTINRGTAKDAGNTSLGNHCYLMACSHIAHDCQVGNQVIMANNASIAGHVHVGDYANFGGYSGVAQYRSIGAYTHIAAMSLVVKDVPDCLTVSGNPAGAAGLNLEGMRRQGFDKSVIKAVKDAYRAVYRSGHTTEEALAELKDLRAEFPLVDQFASSVESSKWGVVRPRG